MRNSYFQFKQFRVEQGRCAMKVTTDGCILGAWTPVRPGVKNVLDIGAGTGLLSLMLAQRNKDICIDAIELDGTAAEQAKENAEKSAWMDRITIHNADVKEYNVSRKYDLIISNPPFFNNSLLSDSEPVNLARHTGSLSHIDLLKFISLNLSESGYASVLLPCPEYFQFFELMTGMGLYECDKLSIKHNTVTEVKRIVTVFSKRKTPKMEIRELIIKDEHGNYSALFKELLAPFYLDL